MGPPASGSATRWPDTRPDHQGSSYLPRQMRFLGRADVKKSGANGPGGGGGARPPARAVVLMQPTAPRVPRGKEWSEARPPGRSPDRGKVCRWPIGPTTRSRSRLAPPTRMSTGPAPRPPRPRFHRPAGPSPWSPCPDPRGADLLNQSVGVRRAVLAHHHGRSLVERSENEKGPANVALVGRASGVSRGRPSAGPAVTTPTSPHHHTAHNARRGASSGGVSCPPD